jgi:hypothetical protein
MTRNANLLQKKGWFDLPVQLENYNHVEKEKTKGERNNQEKTVIIAVAKRWYVTQMIWKRLETHSSKNNQNSTRNTCKIIFGSSQ